jgi:hypothetical protein
MSKQSWWKQSGVERRDARATKDTPETTTQGRKGKGKRPWVVEYRLPKRDPARAHLWSMWTRDGEWHKWYGRRHATQRDALTAMNSEKSKWARANRDTDGIEWRVRNTEEE